MLNGTLYPPKIIKRYPATHTWCNTPGFRAQMRQAELMRRPPRKPHSLRFWHAWAEDRIKDKPHMLPFSGYDRHETWAAIKRIFHPYHEAPAFLQSSGKSRPLFR